VAPSASLPVAGPSESSPSPLAEWVQGALAPLATGDPEKIPPLVDTLIAKAHELRASDIHLTSRRDGVEVRFRIDGELQRVATLPAKIQDLVFQRLKVMARLVVYQRREPQDGRIDTALGGAPASLRVAFLPTLHGEQVVIRLPDPARGTLSLDQLGMGDSLLECFRRLISSPQGAVLLTGPASSGKTTTIYAALRHLVETRGRDLNILTIEDPIEAEIAGATQTQIDPGVNLDFPRALRAALRHDPNVLVVGEIRDAETAQTAIQAALTGHLLIATVHAGSPAGVFTRLAQMGVERYLLATAVTGVLNQRLGRTVCRDCSRPVRIDDGAAKALGLEAETQAATFAEGAGCAACSGTGCRGRLGVFELLSVTAEIRSAVLERCQEAEIAALAQRAGQPTLRDDVTAKMLSGLLSPREAMRLIA
jgi:general secretion pathway protein E